MWGIMNNQIKIGCYVVKVIDFDTIEVYFENKLVAGSSGGEAYKVVSNPCEDTLLDYLLFYRNANMDYSKFLKRSKKTSSV